MTNAAKSDILLEETAERFEQKFSTLEEKEQVEVLRGVVEILNFAATKWYIRAQTYKMLHGLTFLMGFVLAWYLYK